MTNSNNNIYILIKVIRTCALLIGFALLSPSSFSQNLQEIQLANEYLIKGEKTKALEMYRELAKNQVNISTIHNNYLNTMLDLGATAEALEYLKKNLKRDPENIQYKTDIGVVYVQAGDVAKADRYIKDLVNEYRQSPSRTKIISDYLASRSLTEYAILALAESRQFSGNPFLFSLELAMLYRVQGQKDKMVLEYLNYVTQASANTQYVKNVMQALLTKPDELESLERILYERVQKDPDMEVYSDLLIWVNMQQKNFYGAFIQARAVDRRYKKLGERCLEVGKVALNNKDYESAEKCYQYITREYPGGPFFLQAQLGLLQAREAKVRNTYPVSPDSVRTLVLQYEDFIQQHPDNPNALEAQRNEALLYAYYLDEKTKAVELLEKLIANPRTPLQLKSKTKLDLGDIYLLKEEPWESTLLYSQVEKSLQENPVGYEAKLRNAKLSYYKGDFRLAQEHLDILKEATTREIANDALELSLRIKENIALDSTGAALRVYASIELLLYQHKTDLALKKIDELKNGSSWLSAEDYFLSGKPANLFNERRDSIQIAFANQAILDDTYMLEAKLYMERGEFDKTLALLKKIQTEFANDVLADDATFLEAEIYDRQLSDKTKAKELYREFLNKFPGSVFAAEARKRFRTLRGDFDNQETPEF
jgi:outer membrane protein assembly factor BamD (BamD/ComL family)